jgi:hypothetical protein
LTALAFLAIPVLLVLALLALDALVTWREL